MTVWLTILSMLFWQSWPFPGPGRASTAAPAYLISENAEGTGTPSGWTDVNAVNWDNTSVVLAGTQSMSLDGSGSLPYTYYNLPSAYAELWVRMTWRVNTAVPGISMLSLRRQSGDTEVVKIGPYNTDLRLHLNCGTGIVSTVAAISSNTTYNVWVHYIAGSGSNGFMSLGFSATSTEPTSGDQYAQVSNCTATASPDRIRLVAASTVVGRTQFFDRIAVNNTAIGDF